MRHEQFPYWYSSRNQESSAKANHLHGRTLTRIQTVDINLTAPMVAKYEVVVRSKGEAPRQIDITIEFPDEARSLLALLSWTDGTPIHALVDDIGVSFLQRLIPAIDVTRRERTVCMALDFVKSELKARQIGAVA